MVRAAGAAMTAVMCAVASPVAAQDKPPDTMQILREKIRADKKLLVATNMDLTESEAKDFWPIYDAYQKDLGQINARIAALLDRYVDDIRGKSLSDDGARKLIAESVAIEQAEADLRTRYAQKLGAVLPAKKVARYLQIENKIRAIVKYDLVTGVPLVQ